MASLTRCPRCSRRRVEDLRFCPGCGFDYDGSTSGPAPSVAPDNDAAMRRDIARYALVRRGVNCRSRLGGLIGIVVGFFVGGVVAGILTPAGTPANPLLVIVLVFGGPVVGMYLGAWLVVRNMAR